MICRNCHLEIGCVMTDPRGKQIGYYCDRCHTLNPMPASERDGHRAGGQPKQVGLLKRLANLVKR
jgi:hypothetical protein